MGMTQPPLSLVQWKKSWRIIPTLYPSESLYTPIAAQGDWPALIALERLTNLGARQEKGDALFLREGDKLPQGKSAYNIGRPFAFPTLSRFSAGEFGVFYAAHTLRVAVAERKYHTERFLKSTLEPAGKHTERVLLAHIHARMHDLRINRKKWKSVYRANDYSAGQKLGAFLWKAHSAGIVYESVRSLKGECVAVFSPQAISYCRQERYLEMNWDGQKINRVYEIVEYPT